MEKFRILTLNTIAEVGLARFPAAKYEVGPKVGNPDAILVRSQNMHEMDVAPGVKAIARAGAGTNNIPVSQMSLRGVPVFNAPGANANAVKELVIAGMLIAARNIVPALAFVEGVGDEDAALDEAFLDGAQARGMLQLKGHRSVGGMCASIYNAMPIEGVQALVDYMREFERERG